MDVTPVGVVRDRLCPELVLVVEVGDLSVVTGLPLVERAGGVLERNLIDVILVSRRSRCLCLAKTKDALSNS